jgi:NADPH-dependent 2,4-dienoyl-CoA reductase/sulfur reductase-like enzyme
LLVIGTGPSGQKAAVQGAKAGKRVTVIDMRPELLGFVDDEVMGALTYHLHQNRVAVMGLKNR